MAAEYRFRIDESLETGCRRIGLTLLNEVRAELVAMKQPDASIHHVRTRLKRFRALLRLFKTELGEENYYHTLTVIRDAGRQLSLIRDSYILVDTIEDLWEDYYDFLAEGVFLNIRSRLKKRHERLLHELLEKEPLLEDLEVSVTSLMRPVKQWVFPNPGWESCFEELNNVYKGGRKLMNIAWKDPDHAHLHEWRKKVKHLYYQCSFLHLLWPEMMEVYENSLGDLQSLLGKDHDLALLSETFDTDPKLLKDPKRKHILQHLIMQERRALQSKAWPLGYQLYHEQPALFTQRIRSYYEARRMERE